MDLAQLANLGEFIGGIAVLVTLRARLPHHARFHPRPSTRSPRPRRPDPAIRSTKAGRLAWTSWNSEALRPTAEWCPDSVSTKGGDCHGHHATRSARRIHRGPPRWWVHWSMWGFRSNQSNNLARGAAELEVGRLNMEYMRLGAEGDYGAIYSNVYFDVDQRHTRRETTRALGRRDVAPHGAGVVSPIPPWPARPRILAPHGPRPRRGDGRRAKLHPPHLGAKLLVSRDPISASTSKTSEDVAPLENPCCREKPWTFSLYRNDSVDRA